MIRALLDTNLFISYLLSARRQTSAMGAILETAIQGRFQLLFTPGLTVEIRTTITNRADLTAKSAPDIVDRLIAALDLIAEPIPAIEGEIPRIGRDPKDDYLVAHAVVAGADYLVIWDYDLRDMRSLDGVAFVSPPDFLAVLRADGNI